jgi:hypothetical protein
MRFRWLAFCVVLGCGDGKSGGVDAAAQIDSPPTPAMITISGVVNKHEGTMTTPADGAALEAYTLSDANTPIAMATADAAGMYSITVPTGMMPVDGYLKISLATFFDTYSYPGRPERADTTRTLNLLNQGTIDTLSGTFCGNLQDAGNGLIAVIVRDADGKDVQGATVSTQPASAKYCYQANGYPNKNATETDFDGLAYMVNVPAGNVTVSATKAGLTFFSHVVNARAGTVTTTIIVP